MARGLRDRVSTTSRGRQLDDVNLARKLGAAIEWQAWAATIDEPTGTAAPTLKEALTGWSAHP
jgi:hypothetical protein